VETVGLKKKYRAIIPGVFALSMPAHGVGDACGGRIGEMKIGVVKIGITEKKIRTEWCSEGDGGMEVVAGRLKKEGGRGGARREQRIDLPAERKYAREGAVGERTKRKKGFADRSLHGVAGAEGERAVVGEKTDLRREVREHSACDEAEE
ncbi:hypothetical protein OIV57_34160, partial [Burkholderia pseudomallei]|uniref:hypothetical protein n=1 Tax=Burkholderia pseudomallei TaxID=28450 RepID=UPI0021F6A653